MKHDTAFNFVAFKNVSVTTEVSVTYNKVYLFKEFIQRCLLIFSTLKCKYVLLQH